MYYNKLTKAEKQIKLGKLQRARAKMENTRETQEMLLAWRQFLKLPYSEQKRRRNDWEMYYKQVQESNIYLLFQEQKKAFAEQNISRVKELAEQVKEMRINGDDITISQPRHIDPFEFDSGAIIKMYLDITRQIKELTDYTPDEEMEGARVFA